MCVRGVDRGPGGVDPEVFRETVPPRYALSMPREGAGNGSGLGRRAFVRAAAATGVALGLAGCSGDGDGGVGDGGLGGIGDDDPDGEPVTFGQPALLSGDRAFEQAPVSAAADLARKRINDAGGILDGELQFERRDTAGDPEGARDVFDRHVEEDGAAVVTGFTSAEVRELWERIQETEVPVVSMFADGPFLDERGGDAGTRDDLSDDGWVWRTTGSATQHAAAAAVYAGRVDATTVGVVGEESAGARNWADAFLDAVRVVDGLEVAGRVDVAAGADSYRSALDDLYGTEPDLWGLAAAPDSDTAAGVLREWQAGDYGGKVMLSNSLYDPAFADRVGGDVADAWVRAAAQAIGGPGAEAYLSAFEEFVSDSDEYDDDLEQNDYSAAAYDAVVVCALAIQSAESTDHDDVQNELSNVARPPGSLVESFEEGKKRLAEGREINYQGAQSVVDFDDFGDAYPAARAYDLGEDGFTGVDQVSQTDERISPDRIREVVEAVRELDEES